MLFDCPFIEAKRRSDKSKDKINASRFLGLFYHLMTTEHGFSKGDMTEFAYIWIVEGD